VYYRLEKIMAIEIKELVSNGSVLVDLTDAESIKVYGGYAEIVRRDTGNSALGDRAAAIVQGKSAFDTSVVVRQRQIGIPRATTAKGVTLALTFGLGTYNDGVTTAKLEG
jgi:hypothetical protein